MIKDGDSVSRYIDPLVYQYIITASRLHKKYVTTRPFAYSFDVFIRCNNSRYVTTSDVLSVSITTSSVTSIPIIYHIPIKNYPIFNLSSVPLVSTLDPDFYLLPFHVVPHSDIT